MSSPFQVTSPTAAPVSKATNMCSHSGKIGGFVAMIATPILMFASF